MRVNKFINRLITVRNLRTNCY